MMSATALKRIGPQEGPQEAFLSSLADIVIYGGAAGGGKSFGLLLEPLRHLENGDFGAVIFRRTSGEITNQGGLWDTSMKLYPYAGATPVRTPIPTWRFPSGMRVTFAHMQYDKDVLIWQGSQIALIAFDELTHFTKAQFFYMLSRNRSSSGVPGYIRATCNPDADSWVAAFIQWWWDPNTGYPIPERSGVIRYFYRTDDDEIHWADTREELWEHFGLEKDEDRELVFSFTFIASSIEDNPILMKDNPKYKAALKALPTVERERLLKGNWKIRPAAGLYFKRSQVAIIDELPNDVTSWVRAWDMAATEDRKNQRTEDGPAYTAGILIGKRRCGRYVIADVINARLSADAVRQTIKNTAIIDKVKYRHVRIRLSQDPGQAGKDQAEQYVKMLAGYSVNVVRESGSKETRAEPFAAQWQHGNVDVLAAEWNETYFSQLESFPESKFKDMVDGSANGFNEIESMPKAIIPPADAAGATRPSPWKK